MDTSLVTSFLRAPLRARSYGNLLYLVLAFPLGLAYFIFLSVGLSLGLGLLIIWIGIPILALALAGSWGLAAFERSLAIGLLGVEVPPMLPPAPAPAPERGFWRRVRDVLANPVTWKGMAYLLVKLPLGVASFVVWVTLLSISGALVATPFFYRISPPLLFAWDGQAWQVDTFPEALLCALTGLVLLWISINLLNGLAAAWGALSRAMLGSPRFAAAPAPAAP